MQCGAAAASSATAGKHAAVEQVAAAVADAQI
jgi:hypothetical protein